jgi:hypothetical protein
MAIMFALPYHTNACDVCGCSAPMSSLGALPRLRSGFVGLRWENSRFTVSERTMLTESGTLVEQDVYNRFDLQARVFVHRRVQLLASMPYRQVLRTRDGHTDELRGLGDAVLSATVIALDRSARLRHLLMAGGGVSLPTGEYRPGKKDLQQPGLQPGTGAFGFMPMVAYTLRWKKLGVSVDVQGRLNTTNSRGYQQGHRADGTLRLFYWLEKGKWNVLPTLGIAGGHGIADRLNGTDMAGSGGGQLNFMPGVEVYWKNVAVSAFYRQPMAHSLGNGIISIAPEGSWSVSLFILFNKRES